MTRDQLLLVYLLTLLGNANTHHTHRPPQRRHPTSITDPSFFVHDLWRPTTREEA